MWIREPVEPASIMRAYCTRGSEGECGEVQCTVLRRSGSVSGEVGKEVLEGGEAAVVLGMSILSSEGFEGVVVVGICKTGG